MMRWTISRRRVLFSVACQLVVGTLSLRYGHPLWRSSSIAGRRPKKKALLIGISYDNTPFSLQPLKTSHEDVSALKKLIIEHYGYAESDVVTMLDSSDPNYDPELQPTRGNILRQIEELVQGSIPEDRFLFHFSGHAAQRDSIGYEEEDGLDECIVPIDSNGDDSSMIVDDELRIHLVDSLCARSHLVAIFDACHSATLLDLPLMTRNIVDGGKRTTSRDIKPTSEEPSAMGKEAMCTETSSHGVQSSTTTALMAEEDASEVDTRFFREAGAWATALDALKHSHLPEGFVTDSATVLTISACSDSQLAWEGSDKVSFTKNIIESLLEDPAPTLGQFIQSISNRTYSRTEKRWEANHRFKAQIQEYMHMHGEKISLELKNTLIAQGECATDDPQDPQMSTLHAPTSAAQWTFYL